MGKPKFFGIREIMNGMRLNIKKSKLEVIKNEEGPKSLRKKVNTMNRFKDIDILSQNVGIKNFSLKNCFETNSGEVMERFSVGIDFPGNDQTYFMEVVGKKDEELNGGEKIKNLNILSGICLFGYKNLGYKYEDGTSHFFSEYKPITGKIEEIFYTESLSVYEIDAILGLSETIKEVKKNFSGKVEVYLELPRVQYYLHLAQYLQKGLISNTQYEKYLKIVDARCEKIFSIMKKRGNGIEFKKINSLEPLEKIFKDVVGGVKKLSFSECVLCLSQKESWRKILEVMEVSNFSQMEYMSYVCSMLNYGEKKKETLLLQIDDPIEQKILSKTQQVLGKINERKNYRIWGMYPTQKIFLNPEVYPNSDLYETPVKLEYKDWGDIFKSHLGIENIVDRLLKNS